jgi:hypothetical protein
MVELICSENRCDIHDVGMVLDDEGGERPRGRNPWRGMCLRIDALDRIYRESKEREFPDHSSSRSDFGDIPFDELRSIVQSEIGKAKSAPDAGRQRKLKTGGTPL